MVDPNRFGRSLVEGDLKTMKIAKKLIEVALPLTQINKAPVREKSNRLGHWSTLHLWSARQTLAEAPR